MDPMLISLITAAVGVVLGYVAPKLAKKTKTTVDDKVVEYVRAHLPEIITFVEGQLKKGQDPVKAAPREIRRDHRDGK